MSIVHSKLLLPNNECARFRVIDEVAFVFRLTDLQSRGLLDDTLVLWGSEFGRTSTGGKGREHNPHAFTCWMAGGGVKSGLSYGETDELGHKAVADKIHVHDLHATILYLLGLDHERLTYRYSGRDFRLTDVSGRVVDEIVA